MTPHLVESHFAESARTLKVERLVNYLATASFVDLKAPDADMQIEALSAQDSTWWAMIARHCTSEIGHRVHAPSSSTIQHIQAELRKRITDRSDPFDLPLTPADRIDVP